MFTPKAKHLITKIQKIMSKNIEDKDIERHRNYPPLKYFTFNEFEDKSVVGSGFNMCPEFLMKLEKARELADVPFIINSGWRSEITNKRVGGGENSAHIQIPCKAVDIKVTNSSNRYKILNALLNFFDRVGIGENYIHVDCESKHNKASKVIWTYY